MPDDDPSNTADLRTEYEQAGLSRLSPVKNALSRTAEITDTSTATSYIESKTRDTLIDGDEWYESYIREAYRRGIRDARDRLEQAGYNPQRTPDPTAAMSSPSHSQDVSQLIGRSEHYWGKLERDLREELVSTVESSRRSVSQASAEIAQDEDEDDEQDELESRFSAVGATRANLIAESETAYAHERAVLREYRRSGITGTAIGVRAEASCIFDERLCTECENIYYDNPYTLQEAENLLPAHPRCRCSWIISTGIPYQ